MGSVGCAGFGLRCVNDALPGDRPVRDDLTTRAFFVSDGRQRAMWVVLDFMDFSPTLVDAIQRSVSRSIGLSWEHVHVLTTHNHSGCDLTRLDLDVLARESAAAGVDALDSARPARVRYAEHALVETVSYKRRLLVPELEGIVTFWYGVVAEDGLSCAELLRQMVRDLVLNNRVAYRHAGICTSVAEESFIDRNLERNPAAFRMAPGDPLLQLITFEDATGTPMGTIARFAVHPATCNSGEFYSSDFPFFLRQRLEDELGGIAIYMNGPCGEISPAIRHKRTGFEKTLGRLLADRALEAIGTSPAAPISFVRDDTRWVSLPVRPDFPATTAIAEAQSRAIELELSAGEHPLATRKRLVERHYWMARTKLIREKWQCLDSGPTIRVALGSLQLNDLTLLAFPGESFSWTAEKAAAAGRGRKVLTVTEHGRTPMYMPPPGEWGLGGYEASCSAVAKDSERVMLSAAFGLMSGRS